MADKDFQTWWHALREDITTYLRARVQLTKLEAYEKISRVMGVMISFFILALLVGFVIIFLLIMVGSWITELTNSIALGFSVVGLLVIGLFIFLFIKRKNVLERPIATAVLEALYDEDETFGSEQMKNSDGKK
jgi:hypothetical protein